MHPRSVPVRAVTLRTSATAGPPPPWHRSPEARPSAPDPPGRHAARHLRQRGLDAFGRTESGAGHVDRLPGRAVHRRPRPRCARRRRSSASCGHARVTVAAFTGNRVETTRPRDRVEVYPDQRLPIGTRRRGTDVCRREAGPGWPRTVTARASSSDENATTHTASPTNRDARRARAAGAGPARRDSNGGRTFGRRTTRPWSRPGRHRATPAHSRPSRSAEGPAPRARSG